MSESRQDGRHGQGRLLDEGSGWVRVPRNLLEREHPLHPSSAGEKACSLAAVVDLLGLCRWKDGNGLERGECRASERFLARRWGWQRSEVRRLLERLEEAGEIEREPSKGRKPSRIRFARYDELQASSSSAHELPRKSAHKRGNGTGENSHSPPTHSPTSYPQEKEEGTDAGRGKRDHAPARKELEEEEDGDDALSSLPF